MAVLATLRLLKQLPRERDNLPLSCVAFATPRSPSLAPPRCLVVVLQSTESRGPAIARAL